MVRARCLWALVAAGTVLAATPASAQWGERTFPIEEIAADLAYGFCPLYLAGQFSLTGNPMLAERGFAEEVSRTPDPRFGEVEQVKAARPDGTAAFGGIPGQLCNVTITGADAETVATRLKSDMAIMGIAMQPDPASSGERADGMVAAFKGALEGQVLHLQIARTEAPEAAIVAQLYVTAQ